MFSLALVKDIFPRNEIETLFFFLEVFCDAHKYSIDFYSNKLISDIMEVYQVK